MPILKYRCSGCGKEFAKIVFYPENSPRSCPVCGTGAPEELGDAFEADEYALKRPACVSCDNCGDEGACGIII